MSAPAFCRAQREGIEAAKEEAARLGLTVKVLRANKHVVMEVRGAGGSRRIALAGSPRTDCHKNFARQMVRRAAKELQAPHG